MTCRWQRWSGLAGIGVLALALTASGLARADVAQTIQKKFRGKIFITEEELPDDAGGPEATVKLYRKRDKSVVEHFEEGGVAGWDFFFLAFMKKKPRAAQVSVDFYTHDKAKNFVANKRFTGVNPKLQQLKGRIRITEDDGLKRGTTYDVKLSAQVHGHEVILATTRVTAK